MTEATLRTMFESYADIAVKAIREGKRVEFEEVMTGGGVVLLACKIIPQAPEVPRRG